MDWPLRSREFGFITEDDGRTVIISRVVDYVDGDFCDGKWEQLESWLESKSGVQTMQVDEALVTLKSYAESLPDQQRKRVLRHIGIISKEVDLSS